MPLPRTLARVNRRVTNPVIRRFAGWLPGFAIVVHRGRRSGREYRTPINFFGDRQGRYVLAVTYGAETEWAKNVLAAGGCALVTRGRRVELVNPRLVRDPERRMMPAPVRLIMRLLDIELFLTLERAKG